MGLRADEQVNVNASTGPQRRQLVRQLAAYSVAAGATVVGMEAASAAPVPFSVYGGGPYTLEFGGTPWFDLNGDGYYDLEVANYLGASGGWVRGLRTGNVVDTAAVRLYSSDYLTTVIGAGELIDGSSVGGMGFVPRGYLDLFEGTRGFVGFRFDIPGGSPHFGYLDVSVNTSDQTVTIFGGAYESETGVGITTVPETSGLGLLAIGAAGIVGWRRNREPKT